MAEPNYKAKVSAHLEKIAVLQGELREMLDNVFETPETQQGVGDGNGPPAKKFKFEEGDDGQHLERSTPKVDYKFPRSFVFYRAQYIAAAPGSISALPDELLSVIFESIQPTDGPIIRISTPSIREKALELGLDVSEIGRPYQQHLAQVFTKFSLVKSLIMIDLTRLQHISVANSTDERDREASNLPVQSFSHDLLSSLYVLTSLTLVGYQLKLSIGDAEKILRHIAGFPKLKILRVTVQWQGNSYADVRAALERQNKLKEVYLYTKADVGLHQGFATRLREDLKIRKVYYREVRGRRLVLIVREQTTSTAYGVISYIV
ncbi:hypothetical protein HDV00_007150 [Rhizophlyctis rosea]|nr:hypothetical protein HDV00_007150 [Rhizophlyctis rosea]